MIWSGWISATQKRGGEFCNYYEYTKKKWRILEPGFNAVLNFSSNPGPIEEITVTNIHVKILVDSIVVFQILVMIDIWHLNMGPLHRLPSPIGMFGKPSMDVSRATLSWSSFFCSEPSMLVEKCRLYFDTITLLFGSKPLLHKISTWDRMVSTIDPCMIPFNKKI